MIFTALATLAIVQSAVVSVHDGKHWTWYARQDQFSANKKDYEALYDYADKAFDELTQFWGLKPPSDKYALLIYEKTGGGFATGNIGEVSAITKKGAPGIGVSYDAFFGSANGIKGYWAYVLITHEMVNLFTGQIVSGGWPLDWWANHRSPFPLMTAVQIEYSLVPNVAIHHNEQTKDPFVQMFVQLKSKYGWHMFRSAFKMAIDDGIHWDRLGPNPGFLLTNYVCAYLQMSAPEPIVPLLSPVVPNFNQKIMDDVVLAHKKWKSTLKGSSKEKQLSEWFLAGNYQACLR